ncbi:solute carrier family 22 member 3-like [Epargyreus clarus]|uniref:solute carrier family 22 member 3-like n=1 Tax=Epargyreus clarus TaxID=520877 RepID=UPI003C2BB465
MKCEIIRRISQGTLGNEINEQANNRTEIKQDNPMEKKQINLVIKNVVVKDEEDYLVKTIGAFGLWQAVCSIAVLFTRVVALWNMMAIAFLTPVTDFECVEFSNNVTLVVKSHTCYDTCLRYNYSSTIGKTVIEEFGLICQDAWLASFTQSILMLGMLLGVAVFGWISDRFGRRVALILSILVNAVFMVAMAFSPNLLIYCIIRLVIGVGTGGALIICVVYVLEITGKQHREVAGACCLVPDGIAEASLAGFAYFTSGWQGYTLSYGVATCIILLLIIFVPESPRWLVSNGKVDEAIKVVTRAAIRNKLDTTNIKADITKAAEDMKLLDRDAVKTTYLDFFKTKKICLLTLIVFIIWFCLGVCFYGIYQYVTIIGSNPYITTVILGLVQLPLCPVGIVLNKSFGRKISTIGTTCVIGSAMIILIFIPEGHWVGTMLGVIGFANANIAFAISYIYVSELLPTPLRNMGYGMSSGGAKIGAMIAPFIANLTPRWMPSLLFGIAPFIAALCCLLLPETKGQNLKDTLEK